MGEIYKNSTKYGGRSFTRSATNVGFQPGESGMTSTTVQTAILELKSAISSPIINAKITGISVGTNPTTNNTAIIVTWYENGSHTSYIDLTN